MVRGLSSYVLTQLVLGVEKGLGGAVPLVIGANYGQISKYLGTTSRYQMGTWYLVVP